MMATQPMPEMPPMTPDTTQPGYNPSEIESPAPDYDQPSPGTPDSDPAPTQPADF